MEPGAGVVAIEAERSFGGCPHYPATATGLVLQIRPAASQWSVALKAGYRFQDEDDGAYGGLEFGYGF